MAPCINGRTGGEFTFENLPVFPQHIFDHIEDKPATDFENRCTAYAQEAIHREVVNLASLDVGNRNDALNTAAFNLGQLVPSGHVTESEIVSRLRDAASVCGLIHDDGEDTVLRSIRSGLEAGIKKPRDITAKITAPTISKNSENSACVEYSTWREPDPIISDVCEQTSPYPIEAFPTLARDAIKEYQEYGRQPLALIGGAVLASMSVAIQGHVDVARDEKLKCPTSLLVLAVAKSGERKTAVDKYMAAPLREFEARLRKEAASKIKDQKAKEKAHTVKERSAEKHLQTLLNNCASDTEMEDAEHLYQQIVSERPTIPTLPIIFFEDTTQEAFMADLAHGYPSAAIWSDEAGLIMGGYSMSQEGRMRTLATFNKIWDGSEIKTNRKTSDNSVVSGRRGTINLSMQEDVMRDLINANKGLSRGIGFLARALMAWPPSSMGTRNYKAPLKDTPAFNKYNARMLEILELPLPMEDMESQRLCPLVLTMNEAAHKRWVEYHDAIEKEIHKVGCYDSISDVASKSAENVARISGLFHVFKHGVSGKIDEETMKQSINIIKWYLSEAQRIYETGDVPETFMKAEDMRQWLFNRTEDKIMMSTISQFGPTKLRRKKERDAALDVLVSHGWIRVIKASPSHVLLNPIALERDRK